MSDRPSSSWLSQESIRESPTSCTLDLISSIDHIHVRVEMRGTAAAIFHAAILLLTWDVCTCDVTDVIYIFQIQVSLKKTFVSTSDHGLFDPSQLSSTPTAPSTFMLQQCSVLAPLLTRKLT